MTDREEFVIEQIKSFQTVESNYVWKTSKYQYLPRELSVKFLHQQYIEWCDKNHHDKKENYDFYLRVFNEKFNVKFHKPKKDRCDKCEAYENTASKTPQLIEEHTLHIEEKENAMYPSWLHRTSIESL